MAIKNFAPLPLFDRLTDENVEETDERVILDRLNKDGLKLSIQKELKSVLNTRLSLRAKDYAELKNFQTPKLFGLKDQSHLNPLSFEDQKLIVKAFTKAIELYYPILIDPKVKFLRYERTYQRLFIDISGKMKMGSKIERLNFPLDINWNNSK